MWRRGAVAGGRLRRPARHLRRPPSLLLGGLAALLLPSARLALEGVCDVDAAGDLARPGRAACGGAAAAASAAASAATGAAVAHLRRAAEGRALRRVAVVTLVGSFNPITVAHVAAMRAARDLLLGGGEAQRPQGLAVYDEVLGFLCANGEERVAAKMAEQGLPAISEADRRRLMGLAISQPDLLWLGVVDEGACEVYGRAQGEEQSQVVELLRQELHTVDFEHFRLDGSDVALRWRSWEHASPERRFLCAVRGEDREPLLKAMGAAARGPTSEWYHQGHFVVLPPASAELGAMSSTAVRQALMRDDVRALAGVVDPAVLEWNFRRGPYRKPRAAPRGAFEHRRGDGAAAPLAAWPGGAAGARGEVRSGERVHLCALDDTRTLGLVTATGGAEERVGWLPLRDLHVVPGQTFAVVARAARGPAAAALQTDRAANADAMLEAAMGETVVLHGAQDAATWDLFAVQVVVRPKVKGWLKVEHLLFAR